MSTQRKPRYYSVTRSNYAQTSDPMFSVIAPNSHTGVSVATTDNFRDAKGIADHLNSLSREEQDNWVRAENLGLCLDDM